VDAVLGAPGRRPGELHEALPLPARAAQRLAAQADALGVPAPVLAPIVVEAALVAGDVGAARFAELQPAGRPGRPLEVADARYLRALTVGRRRGTGVDAPATAAIPVRVARRLAPGADVEALLAGVDADVALRWEIAAVTEGRTLTESVLLAAAQAAG
jgi:hypothetical protein